MSQVLLTLCKLAQNGKAHLALKSCAKPRLTKKERAKAKEALEEEERQVQYLKDAEGAFKQKKVRFEDALSALEENARMVEYMKSSGIMNSEGRITSH